MLSSPVKGGSAARGSQASTSVACQDVFKLEIVFNFADSCSRSLREGHDLQEPHVAERMGATRVKPPTFRPSRLLQAAARPSESLSCRGT